MIRWASIRKDLDRGNIVITGSSSNEVLVIVVTFSVFSRVSSEISMLVDNSAAIFSTRNFHGRSIVIDGTVSYKGIIVVFSFREISLPT
jgi:hypothetical protein